MAAMSGRLPDLHEHLPAVHAILRDGETQEKTWLMSRILESAAYEDVWKYLTLAELRAIFPSLQLKPQVRAVWEFAFQVWDEQLSAGMSLQEDFMIDVKCGRLPYLCQFAVLTTVSGAIDH